MRNKMFRILLLLTLPIWGLNGCSAKTNSSNPAIQVNLMTFNVRYDNPADSANNWKYRRAFAAETILKYNVDLLGTQEVLVNQLTDILGALPQFAYAGVGRKDGKTAGEYSAVFYRKDKFELLNSGTFWLSENPSAIGAKGWDAAIERIVTWVVLKDKTTGKEFVHINTHFDHIGQVARRESSKLLLSKVEEIAKGRPVFVSGDFNATPDSEVIKILVDPNTSNHLTDSRSVAPSTQGPAWTFHGFGTVPTESRTIIDYIFVKNSVTVEQVSVISEMKDKIYLSDHNPILIKASF
jgi:endonuclease/exonuclease/phosphatase family metal-dependent hydrolase